MKLAAVLVVAVSILVGISLVERHRAKIGCAQQCIALLDYISARIALDAAPCVDIMCDAMAVLDGSLPLETCAEKINNGESFPSAFDVVCVHIQKNLHDEHCAELMRLFAKSFGASDAKTECTHIAGYIDVLSRHRNELEEELKTDIKAKQMCCLMAGAVTAIFLV